MKQLCRCQSVLWVASLTWGLAGWEELLEPERPVQDVERRVTEPEEWADLVVR